MTRHSARPAIVTPSLPLALTLALFGATACGGSDPEPETPPCAGAACDQPDMMTPAPCEGDACLQPDMAPDMCQGDACVTPPPHGVRLTLLDVRYDLANPVFVNNRVPISFGLTATTAGEPMPRQVAVTFSFIESEPADPEDPIACSSSAQVVELVPNGEEQRFDGFIWPTTLCNALVNRKVNLSVEFDGGEEVDPQTDSPTVALTASRRAQPLNALCRTPAGDVGCVYDIDIKPTPVDAQGKTLIDVVHAAMTPSSAVALLPRKESEPTLAIDSVLVVNGRDPYISVVPPEEIPDELLAEEPELEEDLQFGLTPEQAEALIAMPGAASLRYALRPVGSTEEYLPLRVSAQDGERADEVPVPQLYPGSPNTFSHELFAEELTRAALVPGGKWGNISDFEVRGCFAATFPQAGNAGSEVIANDCQVLEVVLVRDTPSPSAALSYEMNEIFERSVGGSRISLGSGLETENRLDSSGASSRIEGRVGVDGDIGRSFSIDIARSSAQAGAGFDPAMNGYEVAVTAFGQNIYEISESGGEITREEDFSVAKQFTLPNLGFGFGPVRIGLAFTVGGELGIGLIDSLSSTTNGETCAEALGSEVTFVGCGQIGRTTTPFFAFTGLIEGGVKIGPVSGGVEADLRLVNTEFPLGATLSFGADESGAIHVLGNALWDLELRLIEGDVSIVGRIHFKRRILRRFNRTITVHLFSFSSPLIQINLLDEDVAAEVLQ